MQQIRDLLKFNGRWRSYQKRVLDDSERYLRDRRLHIVAAPGSGKTTLGIELIRRLNAPCLILAPSVNIRDQWLARIREAYLPEGTDETGLLSNSISEPGLITAITYQALHSGMDSDFFAAVRATGIRTICLDEAHHLRSEWWKALEDMVGKMPDCTVISLTATPPYDSTPAQWERYVGLCGPIDEEIIVPELVKEGSLCPHQDYIYFNLPTKEEEDAVLKFTGEAAQKAGELFEDAEFAGIISTHRGLASPEQSADLFLKEPEYLSALLIFLQAKGIAFPPKLLGMLGKGKRLPAMTLRWMEILLQGFLYEDTESYSCGGEYREKLIGSLKAHGLIQKNTVCLCTNDDINKLLTTSKGKLNSILEVTRAEYENLQGDLRLLILTDYIKKEYMQAIGNEEKSVNELGVIPIFENIRRTFSGLRSDKNTTASGERITVKDLRMGVLCGSIVIIPSDAGKVLQSIMEERSLKGSIKEMEGLGFCQVTVSGTEVTASSLVTELFNRGEIRVLIGTKSLLGEGWDSPCINSLILASFVGSFMLSNQMRGRAIRVMKGNPDKVSNIWHLICMQPEDAQKAAGAEPVVQGRMDAARGSRTALKGEEETEDFATLKRRFEGFLGVHYEKNSIENGLRRLSIIKEPYTEESLRQINRQTLAMAADRPALKKKWEDCLAPLSSMELVVEAGAAREFFWTGLQFVGTIIRTALSGTVFCVCLANFLQALVAAAAGFGGILAPVILLFWAVCGGFAGVWTAKDIFHLLQTATPRRYMKAVGTCIMKELIATGDISSRNVRVAVDEEGEDGLSFIYLRGGSEREKDVFAKCVCEFFGVVDSQRYLLESRSKIPGLRRYYCVPELFGQKKEDAKRFYGRVKRYIGRYELHYTRGAEGKKLLLAARMNSLSAKNTDCVRKKKTVRNKED